MVVAQGPQFRYRARLHRVEGVGWIQRPSCNPAKCRLQGHLELGSCSNYDVQVDIVRSTTQRDA